MKRLIFCMVLVFSNSGRCEAIRDFFISCGYGTLAGAALGVVSVAVSENPSEKSMNIARGASLGLYAGIGYGIYAAQHQASERTEVHLWLEPLYQNQKIQGTQLNWQASTF